MKRAITLVLAAAISLSLAACSPAATSSEATCAGANEPLTSLTLAKDPKSVEGGSTACLPTASIEAVADKTEPVLPVTVTDAEDREVTIADASRILALDMSGTIAATVFGLGLGENVVGRDTSTGFEGTEDLPVVTQSGHSLNVEAILELAPTVVLTDTTIGPKEVRQQLRDAGIAVVVVSSERRIDTTTELVTEIATALGVPSRGEELATRIASETAAAEKEISEILPAEADRPRMLFLYARGAANVYYLFGEDSGADSLIDAVGGVDVAAEIGWIGEKPMTAEALVAAQPDILIMMTDGLSSVGGIDGLLERIPALQETAAGQHRRVVDMADTAVLAFGPRTPEVIRALARAVYAPETSPAATPAPSASETAK